MDGRRAIAGSREGQTTFIFCIALTIICLFAGLLLDVAIYVVQRVHVQTVTDCSAYSGAVVQARKLNKVAELNNSIRDTLESIPQIQPIRKRRTVRQRDYDPAEFTEDCHEVARKASRRVDKAIAEFEMKIAAIREKQEAAINEAQRIAIKTMTEVASQNDREVGLTPFVNDSASLTEYRLAYDTKRVEGEWEVVYRIRDGRGRMREKSRRGTEGADATASFIERIQRQHVYAACRGERAIPVFHGLREVLGGRHVAHATAIPHGGFLWNGEEGKIGYTARLVRGEQLRHPPPFDGEGLSW
jgi:hypothetical protein